MVGSAENIAVPDELQNALAVHRRCAYTVATHGSSGGAAGGAGRGGSRASRTNDYWSYTPDDWAEFDDLINRLCDALKLSPADRAAALAARRHMPLAERPVALANLRQKLRQVASCAA
ncbi:MAG: hypothetical protein WCK07_19850 [Betaproteobacteria bacterium]